MQVNADSVTTRAAACTGHPTLVDVHGAEPSMVTSGRAPLFPPRDADPETRRRWLATSPWPEVVFASVT